jgi:hypothetical protein
MELERWKRMCTHVYELLKVEKIGLADPNTPRGAKLSQVVGEGYDIADTNDLAKAQQAVVDLVEQQQQHQRRAQDHPAEYLDAVSAAMRNRTTRLSRCSPDAWMRLRSDMLLGHQRTQFAVGQGGFHVGAITQIAPNIKLVAEWADQREFKTADFLYVYDCGSHPQRNVEAEIKHLLEETGSRRLDILFVSHFDDDHVSGIPALIGAGKFEVDTVVLPYIDDLEKVIAFGRAATCPEPAGAFLAGLIVDPVGTLQDLGARRILFVDNGENPGPDAPLVGPFGGGPEDLPWKVTSIGDKEPEVRDLGHDCFYVRDGAIDVASGSVSGLQLAWKFLPYVKHASDDAKVIFSETAEILLGWEEGSFRARISDMNVRRELVTEHQELLGEAYAHAFGSKNGTSLSLYSGPATPLQSGAIVIEPLLRSADLAKIGWLGTGDAPLRSNTAIDAFETHFGDLLEAVSTFMLPHHGSIHNSNPKRLVADADIYFAAAEPGREDWKHPAPQLKSAVERAGKSFQHVKSVPSSRLEEAAVLFLAPRDWS